MAFKVAILCVSALLVQSIAGQCINAPSSCGCSSGVSGIGIGNIGCNRISEIQSVTVSAPAVAIGSGSIVRGPALASSGGAFITTSLGPVAPSGIRVDSANELYGDLLVSGAVPYLTAVAFEGSFPSDGVASVAYGCGDGEIAIQEVIGGSSGAILNGPSYGSAILPGSSCGCNRIY